MSQKNNNSSGTSTVVKVAAGLTAAAVVGGLVYYFALRKDGSSSREDEISFNASSTKKTAPTSSPSGGDNKKKADTTSDANFVGGERARAAAESAMGLSFASSNLLQTENSMFGGDGMNGSTDSTNILRRENSDAVMLPGVPNEKGQVHYPALRVMLQLARGWTVADEPQLPTPTAAMVQLQHQDYANVDIHEVPPGEVPIVVLMVEDIGAEGITGDEFAAKGKQMLEQQLRMMSNNMVPPRLTKEAHATVGPFTHVCEYDLTCSIFAVTAICFTCVANGMGYQFQFFIKPSLASKMRPDFFSMASQFEIINDPASDNFEMDSFLWMPLRSHQNDIVSGIQGSDDAKKDAIDGSFRIPTGWLIAKEEVRIHKGIVPRNTILAAVQTPSVTKPEIVLVVNKKPNVDLEGVDVVRRDEEVDGDDVKVTEIRTGHAGSKHTKIFESPCGNFWLVTGPTAKYNQVVHDALFANIARSIQVGSTAPTKTGVRYHSPKYGVAFDVKPGGKLLETRLEKAVIMYAPLGQHEINPMEPPSMEVMRKIRESPTVQIRVGDPTNDEDCQESLDAWEKSVEKQRGVQTGLKNIHRRTINGREFLCFESAEMVQIGMGQSEERAAKMFVTMHENRSALIRWEAPTGIILKYGSLIEQMLDSIDMF